MGGMFGGGNKKGGSTPAPDFSKAAMVNSSNPMGGRTWTTGPDGKHTLSTNFTGQAGQTWDALQGAMGKAAGYDPTQARDQAITSNYDQAMSRLNPRLQQQQGQFNASAANSGLAPGTEAYNNANLQMQQGQNDALSTAMANAIRQGNETQQTQMEQMRQPFLQGGMMMNMLGQQGDTGAPLEAADRQYSAQRAQDAQAQAGKGGLLSGLGGIAGTAFGGPLGGMLGGMLGGGGGGDDFDPNLGGYNF